MSELAAGIGIAFGVLFGFINFAIAQWALSIWQRRKIIQRRRRIGERLSEYLDLLDSLSKSGAKVLPEWTPEDTQGWPPENVRDAVDAQRWAMMQWEWHNSLIKEQQ